MKNNESEPTKPPAALSLGLGRLRRFIRDRGQNPAYDGEGRLKYLLPRESNPAACAFAGVSSQTTQCALRLFCDAFDIPEEQMFCLRPSDIIHDIYRAMVPSTYDDMEYERLGINLEEAIRRALTNDEAKSLVTIEDIIRFVDRNVAAS